MEYACLVVFFFFHISTDFKAVSVIFELVFCVNCVNIQCRKYAVTAIGHNLLGMKRSESIRKLILMSMINKAVCIHSKWICSTCLFNKMP